MKYTKENYRQKMKWSLEELADWISEYNQDGKFQHTAGEWWTWFDKQCKPKK